MLELLYALTAGILTIAAPCILPVLPVILGGSIGHRSSTRPLFIVLGFVGTFTALTIGLSLFAQKLGISSEAIRQIAIGFLVLFGITMIFPLWFERLTAPLANIGGRLSRSFAGSQSNWSGLLLGATMGIIWTPCAGPVLGFILTLVFAQKELVRATILLATYAIGASIPMLAIAYGGQYVSTRMRAFAVYTPWLLRLFGVLVIALAVSMWYGYDLVIQTKLLQFYPNGQLSF